MGKATCPPYINLDLFNNTPLNFSIRAIGNACRHNPIPTIIACHRIIAAIHLGGFSDKIPGEMMSIKSWLLQHEKKAILHD